MNERDRLLERYRWAYDEMIDSGKMAKPAAVDAFLWVMQHENLDKQREPLFRWETPPFVLASGAESNFKIDADCLTDQDWDTLARLAAEVLPAYETVEGVPTGGEKFAEALMRYNSSNGVLLIAEDVVTTGGSMERQRNGRPAWGVAAFARGSTWPEWVHVIWRLV